MDRTLLRIGLVGLALTVACLVGASLMPSDAGVGGSLFLIAAFVMGAIAAVFLLAGAIVRVVDRGRPPVAPLTVVHLPACTSCGEQENTPGASYCRHCGAKL